MSLPKTSKWDQSCNFKKITSKDCRMRSNLIKDFCLPSSMLLWFWFGVEVDVGGFQRWELDSGAQLDIEYIDTQP